MKPLHEVVELERYLRKSPAECAELRTLVSAIRAHYSRRGGR